MSKYNLHQKAHYADLIGFIIDLQQEFGDYKINSILKKHYQLGDDLLEFTYATLECYEKYL